MASAPSEVVRLVRQARASATAGLGTRPAQALPEQSQSSHVKR